MNKHYKMDEFHDRLQEITLNYSEGNFPLAVRAFAMGAERTVRDNTVGSCGLATGTND